MLHALRLCWRFRGGGDNCRRAHFLACGGFLGAVSGKGVIRPSIAINGRIGAGIGAFINAVRCVPLNRGNAVAIRSDNKPGMTNLARSIGKENLISHGGGREERAVILVILRRI